MFYNLSDLLMAGTYLQIGSTGKKGEKDDFVTNDQHKHN